jgi:hypothetical protein
MIWDAVFGLKSRADQIAKESAANKPKVDAEAATGEINVGAPKEDEKIKVKKIKLFHQ